MTRSIRLAAAAVLGALLLAACSSYEPGPAGTVVEKDTDSYRSGSTTIIKRYLTVETAGGTRTEFRVNGTDYGRCYRGSAYPRCLQRSDRD
jgi:hypothetical protein